MMTKMRAFILTGHGKVDKLEYRADWPIPKPGDEEVLIDPWIRDWNDPLNRNICGYFGSECDGGFAEYTSVDYRNVHPIKSNLSSAELATFTGATVVPPGVFGDLIGYIESGEVLPLLAQTFPLSELHAAQQAFIDKKHIGNIVVINASAE